MKNFYTPSNFNPDKYKKSGWRIMLVDDPLGSRLIVRVSTGRKHWPLFSLIPNFEMGLDDVNLREIKFSLNYYTFPMIDRFIKELNIALSDLYQVEIDLYKIESIKKEGFGSSNF
jgi:hypothetical protein